MSAVPPFPAAPRLAAGLAALAALVLLVVLEPIAFVQAGCGYTGVVLAASALVLVVFLAFLALSPATLQRVMTRLHSPVDLRDSGHVGATIIMAGTLFFVLGWGGALTATATLETTFGQCALGVESPVEGNAILRAVTLNLAVFTLPVLLYVSFVHGLGPTGALRALGLKNEGAARAIALGALVAFAFLALLAVGETALTPVLPKDALDNAKALEIARSVTVLGAVGLATGSALGEELFFRGFLQARVGVVATAVVFALAHFSYASASEVVVVFLLALTLGLLYKKTGNLWATIAAHFAFNLVNLVAGIYAS